MRAVSNNLKKVFMSMDESKSGSLPTIQFRQAIRKLNLGLSSGEIDQITNYCDIDNSGDIDW